jgi:hypothetical protein
MRGTTVRRGATVAFLLCATVRPARAITIDRCGVTIPSNTIAVLARDVTCSFACLGDPSIACDPDREDSCPLGATDDCRQQHIELGDGATLRLSGHVVQGAPYGLDVTCGEDGSPGRCAILGPGKLLTVKSGAIFSPAMDIVLKRVLIDGFEAEVWTGGSIFVRDSRIDTSDFIPHLVAGGSVRVTRVVGDDFDAGIGLRFRAGGNALVRNIDGVELWAGGDVVVDRVTDAVIHAGKAVRGSHVEAKLLRARDVDLSGLTMSPPPGYLYPPYDVGLLARRLVRLRDSSVTGFSSVDIESRTKPDLLRTTCDHSRQRKDPMSSWGVYAAD